MKEFLLKLGVDYAGYFDNNGNYIVDLPDADAYAVVYSKISKSEDCEEYSSRATDNLIIITYDTINDGYEFSLVMDLENDKYYIMMHGEPIE